MDENSLIGHVIIFHSSTKKSIYISLYKYLCMGKDVYCF